MKIEARICAGLDFVYRLLRMMCPSVRFCFVLTVGHSFRKLNSFVGMCPGRVCRSKTSLIRLCMQVSRNNAFGVW
jgi:hypothetical protein